MLIAVSAEVASARRYSDCKRTDWIDITISNVITMTSSPTMAEIFSAIRRLPSVWAGSVSSSQVLLTAAGRCGSIDGSGDIGNLGLTCEHHQYRRLRYRELNAHPRIVTVSSRSTRAGHDVLSICGVVDDPMIIIGKVVALRRFENGRASGSRRSGRC